ncbi:hypothetical protein SLS63_003244 [Diaporthe eres]|uniref:Chloride channel protein 3 n=1 Tax=Diaporthe eres TaxID=83184 RepID=A0ABR1PHJ7_DIAER
MTAIADAYRAKALRSRTDFWGRFYLLFDGAQGWILSAVVGFVVAVIAYAINVSEQVLFDWKDGYCQTSWYLSEKRCCPLGDCTDWVSWSDVVVDLPIAAKWREWFVYVVWVNLFALAACLLTLTTKTVVPSAYRLSTLDENLAAEAAPLADNEPEHENGDGSPPRRHQETSSAPTTPPMIYYSAAGSGVAEVRVILSGFVLHGFLGLKTLIIKSLGLVLSVASGLSLGKEGPYVHIATCVGNIACRLFDKYDRNDGKRREVLSAAAAAGVAVAFGAPLGGVLFGLEEVAYFFPAKTLFRTFFCCIIAALTLKFLNPYGTHKIVMFQVHYAVDWEYFELVSFVLVGVLGGVLGALFIKASRYWARTFRKISIIKRAPVVEVILVALVTGLIGYWNGLTKLPVAKLLYNLAAPCDPDDDSLDEVGLCPEARVDIPPVLRNLLVAFLIKGFLTVITFGIAVILFELTGSLDYVLPFSLAILVAKWTSDFIEPLSIYDLLTELNSYPFLNNKHKPIFTTDLADLVPKVRRVRVIDITNSPLVSATSLRGKLERLHAAGEIDGGLPILRNDVLVGLIPAPDLEFALDQLSDESSDLCLMAQVPSIDDSDDGLPDPTDFTRYIDPTHKKTFVKYMRELEKQGHM